VEPLSCQIAILRNLCNFLNEPQPLMAASIGGARKSHPENATTAATCPYRLLFGKDMQRTATFLSTS
jgi:hypothetical protein